MHITVIVKIVKHIIIEVFILRGISVESYSATSGSTAGQQQHTLTWHGAVQVNIAQPLQYCSTLQLNYILISCGSIVADITTKLLMDGEGLVLRDPIRNGVRAR